MKRKVVVIADPGIDTAFAVALALNDPQVEVVGLLPTAGNVPAEQATANVHVLVDVIDPPKWPRLASALPVRYDYDGLALHGPGGLGGVSFPCAMRHALHPADKMLVELIREFPRQVTIVNLGPLTTLAAALERDPALPAIIQQTIIVGGCWREPGNVTAVAEFHIALDPEAAAHVLHAGLHPLLIPLDVTRKLVFSPSDLLEMPNPHARTCQFLRQIVPYGIRATANLYGIEGFHLKDVLGIIALVRPEALTWESLPVDVETRGHLTRGMTVIDARPHRTTPANARLATGVAVAEVRHYIQSILRSAV
ncbi:MAG: nucleoside hydrolase [Gemmataceae bacterium]|nr:nucleoside hydrolase [Gemmataceae bacterium]MDW8243563.1 nucleoside hydrolase [Thermogemmata sp.]